MKNKTMKIIIPPLKKPSLKEIQKEFSWVKSIEHDTSFTKKATLEIGTVLKDGEKRISGSEYEKRFPENLLGFQHAKWLVKHQDEIPKFKAMKGIYIDFPGQIVASEFGDRSVFYLHRYRGRWCLHCYWLCLDFFRYERVAFSSKVATRHLEHWAPTDLGNLELRVKNIESDMAKIRKIINLG